MDKLQGIEKLIEIRVIDVNKNEIISTQSISQSSKITSSGVKPQTPIRISYTPTGLNLPFYCDEPSSVGYPNGYRRMFYLENDFNDAYFDVMSDSIKKYDIVCSDD